MAMLDNAEVNIPCPKCDFFNDIFFKQARLRDVIICRGCKRNIQLDDQMNECRKAVRMLDRAIKDLQNSFKSMTIKF